jgi:CO/xanthine dehydrogenase Mo-binding subunit
MSAGAYRGYGATQGLYAVETAVNELAEQLDMDPIKLREMNIVREGQVMPAYYGAVNTSCALDRCIANVKRRIDWDSKYPCRDMGNGKVRSVGMALAMQGSGIGGVDVGSASLKMNDGGFYTLKIGAADMGTGCDTVMAQIVAEVLDCSVDEITVYSADTDISPYDSGSYASSTTYVTGKAAENAALKLRDQICAFGAQLLGCEKDQVTFDGECVICEETGKRVSREEIGTASQCGSSITLEVTETNSSPDSPPPFMAGAAEIEVDLETGQIDVIDYVAAVDCGTPVNTNLVRVQAEGGILQGIGMALTEDITYTEKGQVLENSLMQYKIPTRQDIGRIRVEFECSYENLGPFGAKSIGEIVINTPSPAITAAVHNATGLWFRELPITPEKIVLGLKKQKEAEK